MAEISTLYIKVDSKGVVTATKNLKDLDKQARTTAKGADKLTTSTTGTNKAMKNQKTSLAEASSGLKTVGRDLTRYSLLMAGAGAAIAKFSFDLSKGMGQVQTLIPQSGDRIFELEQAVKDLSTETGVSFGNLTAGMYQTVSAFQDGTDTINIFTQATKAAVAGGATVADSIELASAVTKAYGDTTAEATQKVFDLAFETVRLGQTTFPELANGIQTATDSAVRLGVSQEELFATFSALTGVIGDASEVATKFRSASASLLNPNANLLKLFKQLSEQTGETVNKGEDFVRVAGGWQQALALIVDTAEESGAPLQSYIRRIEGITLASRLAGNSAGKYATDLIAANDANGAANRSFLEVKDGIDKFRQSILRSRQEIAVSATEIGENLVPRLANLLEKVADGVRWFSELNAAFQNTIINIGAILAVAGPLLILFGSIARAIKGIQALQMASFLAPIITLLGPAGLGAVLAVAVGGFGLLSKVMNDSAQIQKDYNDGLKDQEEVMLNLPSALSDLHKTTVKYNTATGETVEKNTDLLRIYPELIDMVNVYTASENALAEAIESVNEARARETLRSVIKSTETQFLLQEKYKDQVIETADAIFRQSRALNNIRLDENGLPDPALAAEYDRQLGELGFTQREFAVASEKSTKATNSFMNTVALLNADLEKFGLTFDGVSDSGEVVISVLEKMNRSIIDAKWDLAGTLKEDISISSSEGSAALKTWQEWFEQITGVAKERFGNSGKEAGEAFIADLQASLENQEDLANVLGEDFDYGGGLEDLISDSESAILALMELRDEEIANSDAFELADNSIKSQTESLLEYKQALNAVNLRDFKMDVTDQITSLEELNTTLGILPDSFDALSEREGILKKAIEGALDLEGIDLDSQIITDLTTQLDENAEKIANTFEGAKASAVDFTTFMETELFDSLMKIDDIAANVAISLAEVGTAMLEITIDAVAEGFEKLGEAMKDGVVSGREFTDILAEQLKAILDMLPSLFIQAGLSLIANGNVPMGLGFIAAGLTGSIISGLTNATESSTGKAKENAKGNAFDQSNIVPFARGGSFTNSVVDSPTQFAFANGGALGLMGEAGPEAIMPLTRTSSGELGVQSTGGGGSNVVVNVVNNTGANVSTNEKETPNGKEIEIIIGEVVNGQLASGKYDKTMGSRYGSKPVGFTA